MAFDEALEASMWQSEASAEVTLSQSLEDSDDYDTSLAPLRIPKHLLMT
jgi:hypothetical protein